MSPWQQPFPQFCGPQEPTLLAHARLAPSQYWKPCAWQSMQAWPRMPQAPVALPCWQRPAASQQPVLHVDELHPWGGGVGPSMDASKEPPSGRLR
jgi:hypothetical protein